MIRRDPDELVVPVCVVLSMPEDLEAPRPVKAPSFRGNRLLGPDDFHPMARSRGRIRKLYIFSIFD